MVNDPFQCGDPGDERWIVVQKRSTGLPKLCKSLLGIALSYEYITNNKIYPEFGVFSDAESAHEYLNSIHEKDSFEVRRILVYIDPEKCD